MATIVTLGEAMGVAWTDIGDPLRTASRLTLSTAGAEATVAIGLQRLGHSSHFISRVGNDAVGERIRRDLRAEGVDVSFLTTDEAAPSGFMLRDRATAERLSVTYYRAESAASRLTPADITVAFNAVDPVHLVHLTGITACLSNSAFEAMCRAVALGRQSGALISLDVNLRRSLPGSRHLAERLNTLLPDVDILFAGDDELHVLTPESDSGSAAKDLLVRGPNEVVLKRGPHGAATFLQDESVAEAAANRVQVADVIGAGDSFVVGYLSALLDRLPVTDRLARGNHCAALTVGTHGDWQGLPYNTGLSRLSGQFTTER